jgi:hypothetical protein
VTGRAAVVAEASAMDISLEATEMDAESCEAVDFYNPGSARPTAHEVTLLSLRLISHVPDRRELSSWVQGVVKQLEESRAQGISWTPPLFLQSDDGDYEYKRQLARDSSRYINIMGKAVAAGSRAQQTCGSALLRLEPTAAVTGLALRRYFIGIRRMASKPALWGPYADSAGKKRLARHTFAMVEVAEEIWRRRGALEAAALPTVIVEKNKEQLAAEAAAAAAAAAEAQDAARSEKESAGRRNRDLKYEQVGPRRGLYAQQDRCTAHVGEVAERPERRARRNFERS